MTSLSKKLTNLMLEFLQMEAKTSKFAILFRKYRLRAEFATWSELGQALAEKGFIYEDSILSRWQKGERIPNRAVILKLIEIFARRKSIDSIEQANDFLDSAGDGYLTKEEIDKIHFNNSELAPFQVPNQITDFTGREMLIKKIKKEITPGSISLIHGTPGVGKSTLAIHLGYLLKNKFPDGVLWYRLDTSDVMDILLSIAFAFGKDIGYVQDKEIRAAAVRSILAQKKVILIFDNVELDNELNLLTPNNKNSAVLITTRYTNLSLSEAHKNIHLEIFTETEALLLFKKILGEQFSFRNKSKILELAYKVGFLPLAIHIIAKELKKGMINITDLLEEIKQDRLELKDLSYGDKNLYLAINVSFDLLDENNKKVFLSLAIFDGKDFAIEPFAYINSFSIFEAKKVLNLFISLSLVDESSKNRFRIHPMIKKYLRIRFKEEFLFQEAAKYYIDFLSKYDKTFLKSYPNIKQESENVLYIFEKCYELHYWDEVITLWEPLESLLHATNQLNKTRYLYQIAKSQNTGINIFQKILIIYFCLLVVCWVLLNVLGWKITFWNYLYSLSLCFFILPGSILGLRIAVSWGLFKSSVGKAVLFLSAGILSWGVGNLIWAYYNFFLDDSIPYPSLADIGFLPSYPLWTIGIVYLPHALGKFSFRKIYRFTLFIIPILVLSLSYYLVVIVTKNTLVFAPLESYTKFLLDIVYPTGGAIILTTVLLVGTSFTFFGGKYKLSIYTILLGFFFQYIADFLFSYTTTNGIYYNGGISDMLFTIGLFFVTFGILGFYLRTENFKNI